MALIVVGLLLLFVMLAAKSGQSSHPPPPSIKVQRAIPPAKKGWFARWRETPETRVVEAWELLAKAAHDSPNRVAVIRRSCDKARVQLKSNGFQSDSQDLLVILERRVPEWIEGRLTRLPQSSERGAHAHLEVTLELLEEVAASCERTLAKTHFDIIDDDAALTSHIKRQLKLDALSIDD